MDLNNLSTDERNKMFAATNKGGLLTHLNGTAGVAQEKITLSDFVTQFILYNTHASNSISISFNDGVSWFTVLAKSTLGFDSLTFKDFYLKASGATTSYEILYVV